MKLTYTLDQSSLEVAVSASQTFSTGPSDCLSSTWLDPSLSCDWYNKGYIVTPFTHLYSYDMLLNSLTGIVKRRLKSIFPDKPFDAFTLDRYHHYVNEDEHRLLADPCLKRLYAKDIPAISNVFVKIISNLLSLKMGFSSDGNSDDHWIILRINPPHSFAYNPPHKDIYEAYDSTGKCPRMINAWIPVSGVNELAGLGIAPGSHLLPESAISRSLAGSQMNGRKYSVNLIKSWDDSTHMSTIHPEAGSMLCFSSHIVHGLGVNNNPDVTRVALEFRLYAQE